MMSEPQLFLLLSVTLSKHFHPIRAISHIYKYSICTATTICWTIPADIRKLLILCKRKGNSNSNNDNDDNLLFSLLQKQKP